MSVNLSSITLEELPQLPEQDLRNIIIKPLLREIGFDYVEDWHGSREFGVDILIETTDFFNRPRYFGISAKKGNLNDKSAEDRRSITTIHNQIGKAFTNKFYSSNGEAVHLHGYYVIASGSFSREAKDAILTIDPSFAEQALESEINKLKSILLVNEGDNLHKNEKEAEAEWARPGSNRRPPPCEYGGFSA